jgi:hypothetical protein
MQVSFLTFANNRLSFGFVVREDAPASLRNPERTLRDR